MEREREADERWQLELVVVWANILFCDFTFYYSSFVLFLFRESTDTYMMYDPKIYGTHHTDIHPSVTIIFYIYDELNLSQTHK